MNHALIKQLKTAFDGIEIPMAEKDRMVVTVKKEAVLSVLSLLKNEGYNHLGLLSCVDWIDRKTFELVYVLSAYLQDDGEYAEKETVNIIVKTQIDRDKALFLSVIPIFQNAEPYEREIHELFGICFEGHPRLTPLFLERNYKTPPFRKDFDTRKYVKEVFDNIPSVEKKAGNQ